MIEILVLLTVLIPALWCLGLGALLLWRPGLAGERALARITAFYSFALLATIASLAWCARRALLANGSIAVRLEDWFRVGDYGFERELLVDRLSLTFGALTGFLFAVVMKFSYNYLHREPGYRRFFMLTSLLCLGLMVVSFSGDLDLLVAGWELVGVSSVLLIAFFRENPQTVRHSFRTFAVYRFCDVGLLCAAAFMHHGLRETSFVELPQRVVVAGAGWAGLIGGLALFATLGKSAQLPFSNWLPRAMEGPTSSSAIYYGALSVHLGPFLMLRLEPLWGASLGVRAAMCAVGAGTAVYARLVGRTRSDAKAALGYATIVQVGLMFCEIGLGFSTLALIHLILHAGLRTWQLLTSASLLQDFLDNPAVLSGTLPWAARRGPYIHALNGFYLDAAWLRWVVRPGLAFWAGTADWESRLGRAVNRRAGAWIFGRRERA